VGKPEGKRSLGTPKPRWEYNNKMDLREIGWHAVDSIDLDQDRERKMALVNTGMNLHVP
jgi:hypothetical protein